MTEIKAAMGHLTAHVRSFYAQRRAPVALVLVAVITVASVVSYLPLQVAAAIALLGMILQVLFDIDEKVAESKTKAWYPSYHAAVPYMSEEILRRLHRRPVIMRWIGVTHESGWPFSQNILLDVLAGRLGATASLHIELALLDPNGQICQRSDAPLRE